MAKKEVVEVVEVKKEVINPLTRDYNREDLNELRDKINELIARLNA